MILRASFLVLLFCSPFPMYGACSTPSVPTILRGPGTALVDQTYVILWSRTAGDTGSYIVERSTSASFSEEIEVQYCSTDAAAFVASHSGTYHHRVRAVAGCDSSLRSEPSTPIAVVVGGASLTTDSARIFVSPLEPSPLAAPDGQSIIILPGATSIPGANGSRFATMLRIQNLETSKHELDLVFVPAGSDSPMSLRVTIPPSSTLTFDDVIGVFFGSQGFGTLEVRVRDDSADVLAVSAPLVRRDAAGLTESESFFPILRRNEGAKLGVPYRVSGVVKNAGVRTNVTFVETSRRTETQSTSVEARLFARDASPLGSLAIAVPAGSSFLLNDVAEAFGVVTLEAGSLEFSVVTGNGTVAAVLFQIDGTGPSAVFTSQPIDAVNAPKLASSPELATKIHAVLGASHGKPEGSTIGYRTLFGITGSDSETTVSLSLVSDRALATPRVTLKVPARTTLEFPDALRELFRLSSEILTRGTIIAETTGRVFVYGSLVSPDRPASASFTGNLPTVTTISEAIIGAVAGLQRPVTFIGLEQRVDPTTGARWSLELTELSRASAVVTVHLYEHFEQEGRRVHLAKKDVSLEARQHFVMDNVFQAMGFEDVPPTRDRRPVQVVVVPRSGHGRVSATAVGTDKASGRQVRYILTPSGGIAADGTSLAAPLLPPIDTTQPRLRPARR